MPPTIDHVIGLQFVHPRSGESYGLIRACDPGPDPRRFPPGWRVVADDECGNAFVVGPSGAIAFWDHETDDVTPLADSWEAFVDGCGGPEPVELQPGQVKRVSIDPEFTRKMDIDPSGKK